MACCDPKQGAGKCLVFFFTILFGLGVSISTLSPNWIAFAADQDGNGNRINRGHIEVEWGPFYGQTRTCTEGADGASGACGKWSQKTLDLTDCDAVAESGGHGKLCRHLNTWRSTGVLCLLLVFVGGGLVLAASCCQIVTCGCCGNSLTCISNVLFGAEVILSIITWSFAISSMKLIQSSDAVTSSYYQWGFWLFLVTGTIVGAIAAWMADWAAEDSCLRGIWRCITCRRGKDDDDDRMQPLMGDNL